MGYEYKPNIILILTDHFRKDAIGKSTPNLKKYAESGCSFTNSYCAAPLCMPARVAMVTGYAPFQTRVCGNGSDGVDERIRDDGYPVHLQRSGYFTAQVGKHHYLDRYGMGMDLREDEEEIKKYGFDFVMQTVDYGDTLKTTDDYVHYLEENGLAEEFRRHPINPNHGDNIFEHPMEEEFTCDYFTAKTGIDVVNNHDFDNKPLYMQLSFVGPHPPLWHPGGLVHNPDDMLPPLGVDDCEDTRLRRAHYMDKCTLLDKYIGKFVESFKKKGIYDNTVFIFTSDHGDNLGDFGIWDKRFFYEQCVNVPLIMWGPGVPGGDPINWSKDSKILASHLDLYPTILGLAGVTTHNMSERFGKDIMVTLKDIPGSGHNEVFSELGTCCMVRSPMWKLIYDPQQGGTIYLFNLANDPKELNNLAGVAGYERITAELVQKILNNRILLTQYTHIRDENRLQRVHVV